jgi:UDP-N-acetylmuramoyl-tripeptide--D-alanyl-D-alanine ligase
MKENKVQELYNIFRKNPLIITDSRKVVPGTLFFALKGETFNGNDFALEALQKGALIVVVDRHFKQKDLRLFQVENVLATLQNLATFHRQKLGLPVLAITGSNGKTTTKELIQRVLSKKFNSFATEGNLNNHLGVPLSLLSLTESHEFAVIEMGANHQGEIAALCEITQPDYGMITNVGKAHLEGFGSLQGVIKAKTELYIYLRKRRGTIFINSGNDHLLKAAFGLSSYSYGNQNAACIGKIIPSQPYLAIECKVNGLSFQLHTKLIGKYNFENILAAVAIGTYFKISLDDIREAIESYEPSNNRSQVIKTASNTLILDAYNANPSSMNASIENFTDSCFQKKVVILGDMAELGAGSEKEHLAILDLLQKANFLDTFLVGPLFYALNKNKAFKSFESIVPLMEYLRKHPIRDCTLLLKASRKMQLEKIVNVL